MLPVILIIRILSPEGLWKNAYAQVQGFSGLVIWVLWDWAQTAVSFPQQILINSQCVLWDTACVTVPLAGCPVKPPGFNSGLRHSSLPAQLQAIHLTSLSFGLLNYKIGTTI